MKSLAEFASLFHAAIQTKRPLAFFAGAGISRPAGLPLFNQFSKHVIGCCVGALGGNVGELDERVVDLLVTRLRPEVVLQTLTSAIGERAREFFRCFEADRPDYNHLFLALALAQGQIVLTTNGDLLVEEACRTLGVSYQRCVSDTEFARFWEEYSERMELGEPLGKGTLLKLHGSLEVTSETRFDSLMLALNQVGQGLTEYKLRTLRHILVNYDMAFLGYSGCDHFSVLPCLLETPSNRTLYWLEHKRPDSVAAIDSTENSPLIFRKRRDALNDSATAAERAMLDVLSARRTAVHVVEDTNLFLRRQCNEQNWLPESTEIPVLRPLSVPEFVREFSVFQRRCLAARFLLVANQVEQSSILAKLARDVAKSPAEMGEAALLLAEARTLPASAEDNRVAVEAYREALHWFERTEPSPDVRRQNECRIGLANLYRRMRDFPSAVSILDEFRKDAVNDDLAPARLRIQGLVHGLCDHDAIRNPPLALSELTESREQSERHGDVAGRAQSLNAVGLVYMHVGTAVEDWESADQALTRAQELSLQVGNYRQCFQICRNLGLVHAKWAKHLLTRAGDESSCTDQRLEDVEQHLERSRQAFLRARHFLVERMRDQPMPGEVAEVNFRLGEVLLDEAHLLRRRAEHALGHSAAFRRQQGDWHNEARVLQLQLRASDEFAQKAALASEIRDVYRRVLNDTGARQAFQKDPIRIRNANEVLGEAVAWADQRGLPELAAEIRHLLEKLRQSVGT